jgi:transposase
MGRTRSIIAKPEAVVGLDVGKFSHWAYGIGAAGEVTADFPVENREGALDSFFASVEPGTLVVVDQVRDIGALAISRARLAGLDVAYLPGLAEHNAAKLFAGDAKTDARDAEVIAKTALGIPDALRPVPGGSELVSAARRLASQRDFVIADSTHDKNRLRAILLESCPEFESLVDLSDERQVNLLAKVVGPWQIADADPRAVGALTRGARRGAIDALVASVATLPDRTRSRLHRATEIVASLV